jgi:hypothetical protein
VPKQLSPYENKKQREEQEETNYYRELQRQQEVIRRNRAQQNYGAEELENLPIDRLRSVMDRIAMNDRERDQEILRADAAQQFMKKHPGYQACEHNGRAMTKFLEWKGLEGTSPEDLEAAYSELRNAGMVIVDETKEAQLQQENSRFEKLSDAVVSANARYDQMQEQQRAQDPESMSLDELRSAIYRQQVESEDNGIAW